MINIHPSRTLHERFLVKPYQGVKPESSTFLFVGLDANYCKNIQDNEIFSQLLEYHEDGPRFWINKGVHHPFLLPSYSGDGKLYHKNFSRVGFGEEQAGLVSFVELYHLPTFGRNALCTDDLDVGHLEKLNEWIMRGSAKHIFISATVANLMRSTGIFSWLPGKPTAGSGTLKVLYQGNDKSIYQNLHFSNYGKFAEQLRLEAAEIRKMFSDGKPFN
jgi:hypothetical protein